VAQFKEVRDIKRQGDEQGRWITKNYDKNIFSKLLFLFFID
jgi:hypothetical protein